MAVYSDISIDQGSDFSAEVVVNDATGTVANLTGYTGAGQIRKTYSSSTFTAFGVTVTNAGNGVLTITLSNTVTNAMKAGRYVYDVEITQTSNGEITRVVEGQITIMPGVTQ
jgi:outer membrane lipoprotein-sorting protein|tara:strand:+ start:23 stop:358 length:336 start_codon:yes stop_codon:yes gene_type:complete